MEQQHQVGRITPSPTLGHPAYPRRRSIDINEWPSPSKYNRRSLLILTLQNPVRRAFIAAIEWPWWDRIVLFVIVVNTISLLFRDPYDIPAFLPESRMRIIWDTLSTVVLFFRRSNYSKLISGLGRSLTISFSLNVLEKLQLLASLSAHTHTSAQLGIGLILWS
jgi:hypothetical protein